MSQLYHPYEGWALGFAQKLWCNLGQKEDPLAQGEQVSLRKRVGVEVKGLYFVSFSW